METTRLNELFTLLHIPCEDTRILQGISDDTRDLKKDWLFVCRRGSAYDGATFLQEALDKGAVVLCDEPLKQEHVYYTPYVERIRQALLELYYGDLCARLHVIGVTGTNGKTSVASIISQLLAMEDCAVLQIGTGSVRYPDEVIEIHNTTPGCFQLANYFRRAVQTGITHVVMEVSSHAIDQNRISFLQFDDIVYTNITQDHLDYHLSRVHYRYTKFKLRRYLKPQGTIIYNSDLSYMQELVNLAQHACISIGMQAAHFPLSEVQLSAHDLSFHLQGYAFHAKLLGMVNVYNLAEAIVVVHRTGCSYERLVQDCEQLKPVSGRMEVMEVGGFTIWIDYAHTAAAVKELLLFANSVKKGRILTILGCGGERDRTKRPQMAAIAAAYSDIAVFTSDNPRGESVADILQDMKCESFSNAVVFENRYFAIKHTIKVAQNSDIIIIAGKGSEETITAFGREYPFSDRSCVKERLAKEELLWK